MAWVTEWCAAELALEYGGVRVYHTYKNDDLESGRNSRWFVTSPDGLEEDAFDVRYLVPGDFGEDAEAVLKKAIDMGFLTAEGPASWLADDNREASTPVFFGDFDFVDRGSAAPGGIQAFQTLPVNGLVDCAESVMEARGYGSYYAPLVSEWGISPDGVRCTNSCVRSTLPLCALLGDCMSKAPVRARMIPLRRGAEGLEDYTHVFGWLSRDGALHLFQPAPWTDTRRSSLMELAGEA